MLLIFSCDKKADKLNTSNSSPVSPPTKILLLKVDFMNRTFEGGKEINLSSHNHIKDSLPITVEYYSPTDFGSLRLIYKPNNDSLFYGTIIWMGKGKMFFPSLLDTSTKFKNLNYTLNKPDSSRFQELHTIPNTFNDTLPWSAISKLDIVKSYCLANKKIGYFLYTPSVGIGNPYEWDWFFILSK